MAVRPTLQVTIGVAGSGKTYMRAARYVVDEFLLEAEGIHWSNFPWRWPELAARCPQDVFIGVMDDKPLPASRVQVIPQPVLDSWAEEASGPWAFFTEEQLKGAHIAIDEAHRYIGDGVTAEYEKRWQKWVGELRHLGASLELLSQAPQKINRAIRNEAAQQNELVPAAHERVMGIVLVDWAQLYSKFRGKSLNFVCEHRRIRKGTGTGDRAWRTDKVVRALITEEYTSLYDSYSKPGQAEASDGSARAKLEWERYSWPRFLLWFTTKYATELARPVAWVAVGCFFFFWFIPGVFNRFGYDPKKTQKEAEPVVAGQKVRPVIRGERQPTLADGGPEPTLADADVTESMVPYDRFQRERQKAIEWEAKAATSAKALQHAIELLSQGSEIVGVDAQGFVQRDGSRWKVGEEVQGGLYDGFTVEKVEGGSVFLAAPSGRRMRVRPKISSGVATEFQLSGDGPSKPASGGSAEVNSDRVLGLGNRENGDSLLSNGGNGGRVLPTSGGGTFYIGSAPGGVGEAGTNRGVPRAASSGPVSAGPKAGGNGNSGLQPPILPGRVPAYRQGNNGAARPGSRPNGSGNNR